MIYLLVDIIIFAAIAFYIFFKLNKQLGKIDEEEKLNIEKKIYSLKLAQKNQESEILKDKIIGFKTTEDSIYKVNLPKNIDEASKKSLIKIFEKTNISYDFFINGAKIAFESILKAFAQDKLEEVKFLISDKIYQGFKKANDKRKSQGKQLVTNIISFDEAVILNANIISNNAVIVVKFISQQINYISDKNQNLIAGSKEEINKVEDIWTFKKDLKSSNPNWIVSATSHT